MTDNKPKEEQADKQSTDLTKPINEKLVPLGYSALHQAAEIGDVSRLEAILKEDRSCLNKPTKYEGYTPLMLAAQENNLAAVEFLLEQPDIDLSLENEYAQTAYSIGRKNNNKEMNRAFEKALTKHKKAKQKAVQDDLFAAWAFKTIAEAHFPTSFISQIEQITQQDMRKLKEQFFKQYGGHTL